MILVTGGAGFIGSSFVLDWLASHDEPVVNLDKLTYAGNLRSLAALAGDARHLFVRADIGDADAVAATIASWPDVTVYSTAQQQDLLLAGMVDKARRQLGLFRVLLILISTIIMALIIYTLTLDKLHDIAMLKLIGARNRVIVGLILQQALLIGVLGYGLAYWLGTFAFPRFPRLVVIETPDLLQLAVIVVGISVLASLLGIWKAMRVEPNKVLS